MKSTLVYILIVSLCISHWMVPSDCDWNVHRRHKREDYGELANVNQEHEVEAKSSVVDANTPDVEQKTDDAEAESDDATDAEQTDTEDAKNLEESQDSEGVENLEELQNSEGNENLEQTTETDSEGSGGSGDSGLMDADERKFHKFHLHGTDYHHYNYDHFHHLPELHFQLPEQQHHHFHEHNHHVLGHHHHKPLHDFMKKKRPFVSYSVVTESSTVTTTLTLSTAALCAKLINVTGPCRLRRGLWVDEPIVMTFDDDMDVIDGALLPTATMSKIETTALPDLNSIGRSGIEDDSAYISSSVIQSSTVSTTSEESPDSSGGVEGDDQPKFGILSHLGIGNFLRNRFKLHLVTIITTRVSTVTATLTDYVTTSMKTFFVQLCTPSPFPFKVCYCKKKRDLSEIESKNGTAIE